MPATSLTLGALRRAAGDRVWWSESAFDSGADEERETEGGEPGLRAHTRHLRCPSFAGNAEGAVEHVGALLRDGWSVAVTAEGRGMVERAADLLGEHDPWRPGSTPEDLEPGVATLTTASVDLGFELAEEKIAVISESELLRTFRRLSTPGRPKRLASRRRNVVDPLQLKAGDFVVPPDPRHRQVHRTGAARGASAAAGTRSKTQREYLVIEYAPSKRGYPGDKLYVPTDQLDLLTRYVGGEAPALSKMGGSDWAAAKGSARKAVRDIAVELVKLYSARMACEGHAFGPDTRGSASWRRRSRSPRRPTSCTTIDEVKADMERPIPMDRLLSGDVGYGKTEVAVRAAFKAVQDGKQVAMLVPTTLLVRQHLETFTERFAGFPVHLRPCQPVPDRQGGEGDARRARRWRGGCGDRHAPHCCSRASASRTSGSSSSTRSSASASSTRTR